MRITPSAGPPPSSVPRHAFLPLARLALPCPSLSPTQMVAIGAARGIKDMRIPLLGSLSYLVALVAADSFLLYGPPALGIEGAGLGASIAQWVGAATVCGLLARKQVCGWVAAWECGAGLGGRRREATPAALRVAARCAGIPCPCTPATRAGAPRAHASHIPPSPCSASAKSNPLTGV